MGIKESNPSIRGKSFSLKSKQEEKFFNRSHIIIKKISYDNTYSDYNLIKSLEKKSFVSGVKKPDRSQIKDFNWIEYLIIHINKLKNIFHSQWTDELLKILKGKNLIISQNKYFSDFFYHEYQIKTIPNILIPRNDKMENNPINDYGDICCTLYNTELSLINDNNNNYCELDVIDNLGGSYLEINYEELKKDDIAFQYQMRRNIVKKYIKIFKEHIFNNVDHPINLVISFFNKSFSNYIHERIKELENQLENKIIKQDIFDSSIKDFESEITKSLQEFISVMHSAVKLFYSTILDFTFFEEEKDDLINLITSFFFRTGKLYENILELYSYAFKEDLNNFQKKISELKKVKPNKLGIDIRFCLNEDTIKLQKELKNKKKISFDKNNNQEEKETNNNTKTKKTNLFQKLAEDNRGNNLYTINENEEEKETYSNNLNKINLVEGSKNKDDGGQFLYYIVDEDDKNYEYINIKNNLSDYNIPIRSRTKLNTNKDEDYALEKLSFLEDSRNDYYYNSINQMRNSVSNFNNKIYLFPKLNNKLKNNINQFEKKKDPKNKSKGNSLPTPYLSAINLLKSSKNYKTPFEKIILIAAISDQIMESANSFWKDMEPYIKKDYLFIEADEIMTIFLYIIIQSQMPELILFCKIINNFTTQCTKAFNISYNYTLLEASLDYINELKDVKDLIQKDNGFLDASRSIMDISTQRLSRRSFGMGLK